MRAPFQVLVIPFRRTATALEFAVLKRSDAGYWQFVAGGGEDDETPVQAARRETREEIGITGELMRLDSFSTVPKNCFAAATAWGADVYVIPEHYFAIDAGTNEISLSQEHTESRWAPFEEASSLLKWNSNRNALWELNERLKAPIGIGPPPRGGGPPTPPDVRIAYPASRPHRSGVSGERPGHIVG